MSALNTAETQALSDAVALLDYIKRNGYDPEEDFEKVLGRKLEVTRRRLHTLKTMKGYYPK